MQYPNTAEQQHSGPDQSRQVEQINMVAQGMAREVELTRKVTQIRSKVAQIRTEKWVRSAWWPRAEAGKRI